MRTLALLAAVAATLACAACADGGGALISSAAAHFTPSGWDQVRCVRIGDDWEVELKRLQTFGRLAQSKGDEGKVYVDAPRWFRDKAGAAQFEFDWLEDESDGAANVGRYSLLRRMYA